MNAIVVINNYNYACYLDESIGSVYAQTHLPYRVVVVNDGSSDDSVAIIQQWAAHWPAIILVDKANGGQLSCFNAALPYVGRTDVVFMLDADDTYPDDYIETVLNHYEDGVDMVLAQDKRFGSAYVEPALTSCLTQDNRVITVTQSSAVTALWAGWIGRPTSGISLRAALLERLLPYDDEPAWRICADNVLVHGASILGASKRFLLDVRYNYRVHGGNRWFNNPSIGFTQASCAARDRLLEAMRKRIDEVSESSSPYELRRAAIDECRQVPRPYRRKVGMPHVYWLVFLLFFNRVRWIARRLRAASRYLQAHRASFQPRR